MDLWEGPLAIDDFQEFGKGKIKKTVGASGCNSVQFGESPIFLRNVCIFRAEQ
jgi:hypothetical protein